MKLAATKLIFAHANRQISSLKKKNMDTLNIHTASVHDNMEKDIFTWRYGDLFKKTNIPRPVFKENASNNKIFMTFR